MALLEHETKPPLSESEGFWYNRSLPPDLGVSIDKDDDFDPEYPEYFFVVEFDGEAKGVIKADCSEEGTIGLHGFHRPGKWGADYRTAEELLPELEIIVHAALVQAMEIPGVEEIIINHQKGVLGEAISRAGNPSDWRLDIISVGGSLSFTAEGLSMRQIVQQALATNGSIAASYKPISIESSAEDQGGQIIPFPLTP